MLSLKNNHYQQGLVNSERYDRKTMMTKYDDLLIEKSDDLIQVAMDSSQIQYRKLKLTGSWTVNWMSNKYLNPKLRQYSLTLSVG